MGNWSNLLLFPALALSAAVTSRDATLGARSLDDCPGYKASNVKKSDNGLTANLDLAGKACNAYGKDVKHLTLEVTYETGKSTGEAQRQFCCPRCHIRV